MSGVLLTLYCASLTSGSRPGLSNVQRLHRRPVDPPLRADSQLSRIGHRSGNGELDDSITGVAALGAPLIERVVLYVAEDIAAPHGRVRRRNVHASGVEWRELDLLAVPRQYLGGIELQDCLRLGTVAGSTQQPLKSATAEPEKDPAVEQVEELLRGRTRGQTHVQELQRPLITDDHSVKTMPFQDHAGTANSVENRGPELRWGRVQVHQRRCAQESMLANARPTAVVSHMEQPGMLAHEPLWVHAQTLSPGPAARQRAWAERTNPAHGKPSPCGVPKVPHLC